MKQDYPLSVTCVAGTQAAKEFKPYFNIICKCAFIMMLLLNMHLSSLYAWVHIFFTACIWVDLIHFKVINLKFLILPNIISIV